MPRQTRHLHARGAIGEKEFPPTTAVKPRACCTRRPKSSSASPRPPPFVSNASGCSVCLKGRRPVWRQEMHRICLVAAAILGFGAVVVAAEEPGGRRGADRPETPAVPPASGPSSSDLNGSGGVITPPAGVDPEIKQA